MATLSSPTIEDLIVNVRNMLNQPDPANSFWSDDELTAYLNEAVRRYFVEVVQHFEGQFTTTTDLNITTDTETISLPSDFFEMKALYKKVTNGYEMLHYRNQLTGGYSTQGGTAANAYFPSYYLRGNNLVLRPVPNFSETSGLKLEYVQFPETLVTGGDTLTAQISPVFRDLIEAYAVWKAKVKESLVNGSNTAALALQNLNDLFLAFKESIGQRSASPTAIRPFNPEDPEGV